MFQFFGLQETTVLEIETEVLSISREIGKISELTSGLLKHPSLDCPEEGIFFTHLSKLGNEFCAIHRIQII